MKRRVFALAIAGLMLIALLAACNDNDDVTTPTPGTPAPTGGDNENGGNDVVVEDPIEFTLFMEDLVPLRIEENFEGAVSRVITQETGVTLKYRFAVGDATEQVVLMIADRSYPDFVFARSMSNTFIDAGAYLDISDFIDQYGDNIKVMFGDAYQYLVQPDGSVLFIGTRSAADIPQDPAAGFQLQVAALREQGWPEVRTIDQWADVIRNYVAANPTIDGQPTIGYTITFDEGWRHFITLINPSLRSVGVADDGNYKVDPITLEVQYAYAIPELKEYYRIINQLNHEGLMDPDSWTQTIDEYLAKIASGRVVGLSDSYWQYEAGQGVLIADGKFEQTYVSFPATMSRDILHPDYRQTAYVPQNGVGITDNCSDPARAVRFMDYLCREETQILLSWGIEGVHWEIRDGQRKLTAQEMHDTMTGGDPHAIATAIGFHNYPLPNAGEKLDRNGYQMNRRADGEIRAAGYNQSIKDAMAAYDVETMRDLFPGPLDLIPSRWGEAWQIWDTQPADSDFGMLHADMSALVAEHLTRALVASPDDFDRLYDDFIDRMNAAGMDRIGELASEILRGIIGE